MIGIEKIDLIKEQIDEIKEVLETRKRTVLSYHEIEIQLSYLRGMLRMLRTEESESFDKIFEYCYRLKRFMDRGMNKSIILELLRKIDFLLNRVRMDPYGLQDRLFENEKSESTIIMDH